MADVRAAQFARSDRPCRRAETAVPALELTADDHIACRVNPVDLKNRLGNIETDCRDRLHVWLLPNRGGLNSIPWHFRAGGGAVHSIKSGHSAMRQKLALFDHLIGARQQ
jgi:hypothetical protein